MRNKKGQFVKGHKVLKEWKENLREKYKGKHFSPETEFKKGYENSEIIRKKISEGLKTAHQKNRKTGFGFKKGYIPWNKGKKVLKLTGKNNPRFNQIIKSCKFCKKDFHTWPSKEKYNSGIYCSRRCVGKVLSKTRRGKNHPNWKGGIENHKKENKRNDPAYQKWVSLIKKRDNNQCIFKGQKCSGYNIVHHILSWKDFPELRYKINNGITLCQFHHPRKRDDEQRLILTFQELVGSKEII